MNHLLTQMNPQAKGTHTSDTLPNLKNDGQYIKIVTRSGKLLNDVNDEPKRVVCEKLDDG